jgi:glycosyltransferase involved in cell wall biosynthesis
MGVSFVICTYNDSIFLSKAIPSCNDQDIEKEIILVDDCSTIQFSNEILDIINKFNVKVIKHEKNQGLSASRNTGILNSRYEWIIPLDSDDWFYPQMVKYLFENKDNYDIVCGNCTDDGVYAPAISREILTEQLFKRENPLVCSSLFNKSIWVKVGGYMVRNGPHYEDWNFWARCFKAGAKFKYFPINVYNHTSRPESMLRILHPNSNFYKKLATEGIF